MPTLCGKWGPVGWSYATFGITALWICHKSASCLWQPKKPSPPYQIHPNYSLTALQTTSNLLPGPQASRQYFIYLTLTITPHLFHHHHSSGNPAASTASDPHRQHSIHSRHLASIQINPADMLLINLHNVATMRRWGASKEPIITGDVSISILINCFPIHSMSQNTAVDTKYNTPLEEKCATKQYNGAEDEMVRITLLKNLSNCS